MLFNIIGSGRRFLDFVNSIIWVFVVDSFKSVLLDHDYSYVYGELKFYLNI